MINDIQTSEVTGFGVIASNACSKATRCTQGKDQERQQQRHHVTATHTSKIAAQLVVQYKEHHNVGGQASNL